MKTMAIALWICRQCAVVEPHPDGWQPYHCGIPMDHLAAQTKGDCHELR